MSTTSMPVSHPLDVLDHLSRLDLATQAEIAGMLGHSSPPAHCGAREHATWLFLLSEGSPTDLVKLEQLVATPVEPFGSGRLSPLESTPEAQFAELLADLFEPVALHRALSTTQAFEQLSQELLPPEHVPPKHYCYDVVKQVARHGMIDSLLDMLKGERPNMANRVHQVRRAFLARKPLLPT